MLILIEKRECITKNAFLNLKKKKIFQSVKLTRILTALIERSLSNLNRYLCMKNISINVGQYGISLTICGIRLS